MGQRQTKEKISKTFSEPASLETVETVKQLFLKYDADKNGTLDRQEVTNFLRDFMKLVERRKLLGRCTPWNASTKEQFLKKFLERIDADSDGKVTLLEFIAFMEDIVWVKHDAGHYSMLRPVAWTSEYPNLVLGGLPVPFTEIAFTSARKGPEFGERLLLKLEPMIVRPTEYHKKYLKGLSGVVETESLGFSNIKASGYKTFNASLTYNTDNGRMEENVAYVVWQAGLVYILRYQTIVGNKAKNKLVFSKSLSSLEVPSLSSLRTNYGAYTLSQGTFNCNCWYPWGWTQKREGVMISPLEQYNEGIIDRLDFISLGERQKSVERIVKEIKGDPDMKIVKQLSIVNKLENKDGKDFSIDVLECDCGDTYRIFYMVTLTEDRTYTITYSSNAGTANKSVVEEHLVNAVKFKRKVRLSMAF